MLENTAGVALDNTAGNRAERFLLRGFVSTAYSTDGFVINPTLDRSEGFLDLVDVQQIEVLKGPSSVLFGRNNPGGIINITSLPPTRHFSAKGTARVGSFDFKQAEGSVSGALDEAGNVLGRASASVQDSGTFMGAGTTKRKMVSGAVAWQANDKLQLDASVKHIDQTNPFVRGLPADGKSHKNPIELGLKQTAFYGEPWSKSHTKKTTLISNANYTLSDDTLWKNALMLAKSRVSDTGVDYRGIKDGKLRRRYNDRTEDAFNVNLTSEIIHETTLGSAEHKILLGTDLARGTLHFTRKRKGIDPIDLANPTQGAPMPPAGGFDRNHLRKATTAGLYLQDQITLNPKISVLAGTRFDYATDNFVSALRYDSEKERKEFNYTNENTALSNRLGAVYHINPNLSAFANYSEGFMPNTGTDSQGQSFSPEKSRSYEAGLKFEHRPTKMTGTLSLFNIDKFNVKTPDPNTEGFSILTGEQKSVGAELDLRFRPTDSLELIAQGAYTDAKITKDNQYQVGSRLVNVPKLSGSLWTGYRFMGDEKIAGVNLGDVRLSGGINYVGERQGELTLQDKEKKRALHATCLYNG